MGVVAAGRASPHLTMARPAVRVEVLAVIEALQEEPERQVKATPAVHKQELFCKPPEGVEVGRHPLVQMLQIALEATAETELSVL